MSGEVESRILGPRAFCTCTPPPASCFHGQQTWVGGPMLSVPWSQAFRLSLPGPQVQMKDHQRCPRQG